MPHVHHPEKLTPFFKKSGSLFHNPARRASGSLGKNNGDFLSIL
jgi:hypothetical protein